MNRNTDISPEEFAKIEEYLLDELPPEAHEAFALNIQNNPELKNKTESVALMLVGIRENALEDKLDDFHREISTSRVNNTGTSGRLSFMKRWIIAASLFVIVGLAAIIFLTKPTQHERVFTQFFTQDPGLITAMGTTDNYLFEHAMIDYKTKKYDSALKTWQELLKSDPASDTLNYFIGSALLADERTAEAIPYLKKITVDSGSSFRQDAYWYLGLALVKEDKVSEAIAYLEKSTHKNRDAVLRKLKK